MPEKTISTIAICLLSFFAFGQTNQMSNKDTRQVILFVCEHGAARSPIAAAYFNKLSKKQGLNFTAIFRGTAPDSALTQATAEGLAKDGFDTNAWYPHPVLESDLKNVQKIVTFDCDLPKQFEVSIQTEKWDGIPPISQDYNIARTKIVERVNQLVQELAATQRLGSKTDN